MKALKPIFNLGSLGLLVIGMSAQTPVPNQIKDVTRVKNLQNAAQLGSDGKVLPSQLPPGNGGGASQTAQLLDWVTTRVTAQQLRTGSVCVLNTPCTVNIGGVVSQFSGGPYTFTLTNSHSGVVCLYINNLGGAIVGYGNGLAPGDITPSGGFTAVPGINSCPQDALVLAKWNVTAGAFDAADPSQQLAAYLSYKPSPIQGTGILVTAGARDTIAIDTGAVMRKYSCAGGPTVTLPGGAAQGDECIDYTAARAVAYVCANASGCTVAADWKGF